MPASPGGAGPSGRSLQQHLPAVFWGVQDRPPLPLQGQLGPKASRLQLGCRQQGPLTEGPTLLQQRRKVIGWNGGGLQCDRCRAGCSLAPPAPRRFVCSGLRLASRPDYIQIGAPSNALEELSKPNGKRYKCRQEIAICKLDSQSTH